MQQHVAGPGTLRARNRWAVLQAVQSGRATTRADLARRTGLSASTVSGLVAELVAAGVLAELAEPGRPGGSTAAGGGRPPVGLTLDPSAGLVLGVHLGHGGTRVLVTTLDGTVTAEHAQDFDVDHEPARTLDLVSAAAGRLLGRPGRKGRGLLAVGVAVSAPVVRSQVLGTPPMLNDWGGVDIAAVLAERLSSPVHLGNDADLGALAEWRLGAGVGVDELVYLMLSEGVGVGLILGGRPHRGATGAAGEFGHVTVAADGQICRCGNRGCLETVVGARALVTALAHTRGPNCTIDELLALAASGDRGVHRLLGDAGRTAGRALATVCTVLDPQRVVVGGTLADAGAVLTDELRSSLHHALPPVANHHMEVVSAALGDRSEALGAALLAADGARQHLATLATLPASGPADQGR